MFKNRIRTAAIAGIAALATGLGGFAVPTATAQVNVQDNAPGAPAGEYWDDRDASAAFGANPVNHTEDDLKLATDVAQNFIENEAAGTWRSLHSNLDYDPSEEATAERLRVIQEDILEAQQENSDTIKRVRESIAYAFQQDQEATDAWQAVVERAFEINVELREEDQAPRAQSQAGVPLGEIWYVPQEDDGTAGEPKALEDFEDDEYWTIIELINYYADRDGFVGISEEAETALTIDLEDNPSDVEVRNFYLVLQDIANREDLERVYEETGEFLIDGVLLDGDNRYSRHAVEAITELFDEVGGYLGEMDELLDASAEASREAQQSDVLVRQGFLQRALAQREVLRNAEGLVLALARYAELYNDPTLTGDRTLLSTEYRRVIDNLYFSLYGGTFTNIDGGTSVVEQGNLDLLEGINENVLAAWDSWENDLNTNADVADIREGIFDEWNFEVVEQRIDLSTALYTQLIQQGVQWREALNRVVALENEIGRPSDTDRLIDAIRDLINGNGETPGNGGGETPGNGDDDDDDTENPGSIGDGEGGSSIDIEGSSEDGGFGTIGILAGIAAVIGLIAAAIPFLGHFIPNLPF